jgi:polysaccharide export outer membrane protein
MLGSVRSLLLFLLAASVAHAQNRPAPVQGPSDALQPGDYIVLSIWREPDLSDTVQVGTDGQATFPKLGRLPVAGIPLDTLTRRLVDAYSTSLRNPSIEVKALRRITIGGAVRSPNLYPVDATMTIADAVALAGGPAPEGKMDRVQLRRGGTIMDVKLDGSTKLMDTPIRSGDQLYVPERSWVSRNAGLLVGIVGAATSIVFILAD